MLPGRPGRVPRRPRLRRVTARETVALPPLRYLTAADVEAAIPPVALRLSLAERAMRALGNEAELPPKIGVHPRPEASFAHAMPAHLRDAAGQHDLLGVKWIAGFPTNSGIGLRGLYGLLLLNDPATGVPIAIVDAGPLTAHRTAAVSGLAIRDYAPLLAGGSPRVGLVGAGVQAHSHLPVIAHLVPGASLRVFARRREQAEGLAEAARAAGLTDVVLAASAEAAVSGADIVVTVASFGPVRQVMTPSWLTPDALVVPVDYATYASAAVARDADLFLVDDRGTFEANRAAGLFDDYPDPHATIGEALARRMPRPAGRVVVTHLGVGLADLVFADAVLAAAANAGLGTILPR